MNSNYEGSDAAGSGQDEMDFPFPLFLYSQAGNDLPHEDQGQLLVLLVLLGSRFLERSLCDIFLHLFVGLRFFLFALCLHFLWLRDECFIFNRVLLVYCNVQNF